MEVVKSKSAEEILKAFRKMFNNKEIQEEIISDNGNEFCNELCRKACMEMGIQHT